MDRPDNIGMLSRQPGERDAAASSSGFLQPTRRRVVAGVSSFGALAIVGAPVGQADAQAQSASIGIAFNDIPRLWGGPEGGFQGVRFAGFPIYDALINWDLSSAVRPSGLIPGLAESWSVDPNDKKRWIVKLRRGVRFHDGSQFDADAAVWNFASVLDKNAPQYYAPRAALIAFRLTSVTGAKKVDDHTIAVFTRDPDAMTPYQLSFFLMVSPAQYAKLGRDWNKFSSHPSGTGPFAVTDLVPRKRLELTRNESYWDSRRIPKSRGITMVPIPDDNSRLAALRSGQLELAESMPSEALASLRSAGFKVDTTIYPAILKWNFNYASSRPLRDIRVRKAANLAIDREGLVQLLNGTVVPAKSYVDDSSPWFAKSSFKLEYDPNAAKALMAAAGFDRNKRLKLTALIPSDGNGQMSLATNEFIQANLAAVGIDVDFKVVDFVTMLTISRGGAKAAASAGIDCMAIPGPVIDPTSFFLRGFHSKMPPPKGSNWGFYSNPKVDAALDSAAEAFDPAALNSAIATVNRLMVDDAASLLIAHDVMCWGLSSRVRNFVQARNWFVDLTGFSLA